MAILTSDIKLLKSSVMADTTDGGGQLSSAEIIDGQSNNLFPDTSAMDRAFGRVNLRKVFGVAHTTDTDTLLGTHAVITAPPADPLVSCALMKTSGWADTRTAARSVIENYLVKGPKAQFRIYDTHYAGSLLLRLYSFSITAQAPVGGDAIVIRNPSGAEQYVRVLRTSQSMQSISMLEGSSTVTFTATVITCDLGQALSMDVLGPPAVRVFSANGIAAESTFSMLYTTSIATGAKFYGIKPLADAGTVGDVSVLTDGGIYTPLVPAATIETPVIDQYPFLGKDGIMGLAYASATLPTVTMTLGPNAVLHAPTAIAPKSISLVAGSYTFLDDGAGNLTQAGAIVGTVAYLAGTITLSSGAPSYGSLATTLTYKVGTRRAMPRNTASFGVTLANQGLSYTNVFSPLPGPFTFALDYMAQGRWYTLFDDGNGKLAGADAGYGIGTINYATGSVSVTLGAIPDIGSILLASWGGGASVVALASPVTTLWASSTLSALPAMSEAITLAWANGATSYTASANSAGVISGDASGQISAKSLTFLPSYFPSGALSISYKSITGVSASSAVSGSGLSYTLGNTPVIPGSVGYGLLSITYPSNAIVGYGGMTANLPIYDRAGKLYVKAPDYNGPVETEVGTINYASGAISLYATLTWSIWQWLLVTGGTSAGWYYANGVTSAIVGSASITVNSAGGWYYQYGTPTLVDVTDTLTLSSWALAMPLIGSKLVTDATVLTIGSDLYTTSAGILRKGWDANTGAPTVASAGVVSSAGSITVSSLPTNHANSVTWANLVQDGSPARSAGGIFRTANTPLKVGVMQLLSGALSGTADDTGAITGAFGGTADFMRGIVKWTCSTLIDPDTLTYNAVFLQYLPLDASLLGIETARLPLDGKVPIYRAGDLVVVHNTLTFTLPNPLVKDTVYSLGRERIASVRVKDALGVVLPDTLYVVDLNAGTIAVPTASNITSYTQPLAVEHRMEDMLLCSAADQSGLLSFTRSLTHDFPADTSFVSSALPFGDLFARHYSLFSQNTWTSVWQDTIIGSAIIAQFNDAMYPVVVTNTGAIKERWLILFTNTTAFRVIGESVGEIGSGNTSVNCAPTNPATGAPYFTLPALGWGSGWSAGNCLRFNTDACGTPFWAVRTVLQGPTSTDSDQFTLAFRGDVDRP